MLRSIVGWTEAPGRVEYLTGRSKWLGFGVLVALAVIGPLSRVEAGGEALAAAAGGIVVVAAGVLLVRVRKRLVLPGAALATAGVAMFGTVQSSNVGWIAVCVLGAWCVLGGRRWAGLVFWAGSVLLFAGEWLADHDPGWEAWVAGVTFTVIAAAIVRHELNLVDQLRTAQVGLAERSRAEERNRIAREVHDVIAHTLTVSLLHLSSARLAVEYEPASAAESLAEAERLCRQSLAEVRSTVGLLRQDTDAGSGIEPPVPGVDGVTDLVGRFRTAGADVALLIDGDTGLLPATTGSAVYRILQESLTNTARHAPGAPVEVRLTVEPSGVILLVDSAGRPGHGTGLGLLSMHERAEALGGRCAAGPGGTGWTVHAVLPLAASSGPGIP